jgi:hypothetical protein
MLLGTPFEAYWSPCAPLIWTTGNPGSTSLICAATPAFNRPSGRPNFSPALNSSTRGWLWRHESGYHGADGGVPYG